MIIVKIIIMIIIITIIVKYKVVLSQLYLFYYAEPLHLEQMVVIEVPLNCRLWQGAAKPTQLKSFLSEIHWF